MKKIKFVSKEIIDNKTIITTETKGLFRTKIRKFESQKEWVWLELPGYDLVPTMLSFQLDKWSKALKTTK